ncbi:MAG: glycosyltransferase family 4 protein [Ignavibacterium sp.]|jgi:glycosyltransferase involved in cell wall biosynthesis|uniref:glycosyltransferase family 4 protein n=1 Tax=Ignavibacterium sp. TaxID=2651167 RepID=UPI003296E764
MSKIKILHLTYDFAEENQGSSTVVVKDLIEESSKYLFNKIITLKRTTKLKYFEAVVRNENFLRINHFGFPYGLFLKSNSYLIADRIVKSFSSILKLDSIDAIHAHKLTFEGFIGYKLSCILGTKLIVSIRQTDFLVLKYRPDLIPLAKKILTDAVLVFYIAPYMKKRLSDLIGSKFLDTVIHKFHFLPNPIDFNFFQINNSVKKEFYLTVLWLHKRSVKRKNLFGLFEAIKLINIENFKLKIIGKGDYEQKVQSKIQKLGIEDKVELLGFRENKEIKKILSESRGLLLPSFSETFGVVYAEALLSGVPILYSKDTGFDGIFENVGIAVDPFSIESIAEGIQYIDKYNEQLHKNISDLQASGAFEIFRRETVGLNYTKILNDNL